MAIKSPFPGMNPYLEQHWRDVHARLITYASDAIQAQLPPGLRASNVAALITRFRSRTGPSAAGAKTSG